MTALTASIILVTVSYLHEKRSITETLYSLFLIYYIWQTYF